MQTYSLVSYKGGAGRTSVVINVAEALTIQGQNVLLIDFDLEAPGLPIFSSLTKPNPLFQPSVLYRLTEDFPLLKDDNISKIHLPGLLSAFSESQPRNSQDLERILDELPIYESYYKGRHPLEGRLFMLPAGGRFLKKQGSAQSETEQDDKHTEWIYYPPEKKELETLFRLLRQNWMLQLKLGFFDALLNKVRDMIAEKCGIRLDYILLDERPGLAGRTLLASKSTDGIVLVSSSSRGNLAGIKELANTIGLSEDKAHRAVFPPINGLVLSPLLSGFESLEGGKTKVLETLIAHENRLGWRDLIKDLKKHRHKPLCLADKNFSYYQTMFDASSLFGASTEDKIQKDKKTRSAISQMWGRACDDLPNYTDFFESFIPLEFNEELQLHDRPLRLREYAQKSGRLGGDEGGIRGIIILACHLRTLNRFDFACKAWQLWQSKSSVERDWGNLIAFCDDNWQVWWYYALWLYHQNEMDEAVEAFNKAEKYQNLKREQKAEWLGDWRLLFRRAHLHARLNTFDLAEKDFRKTLECLNVEKTENTMLKPVYARVQQDFANFLFRHDDYESSWNHYLQAFDDHHDPAELVENCLEFLSVYSEKNKEKTDISYSQLDKQVIRLISYHQLRPRLLLPFARIKLEHYWLNPVESRKNAVEECLKLLREIEALSEQGGISLPEDGGSALHGEALLESARLHKGLLQQNYVLQALEKLEEAVQRDAQELKHHLYLALARLLDQTKLEERLGEADAEVQIRKRDAFYAFEQAIALYLNPDDPTHYFEGENALFFSNNLGPAIYELGEFSLGEYTSYRIKTWLTEMLPKHMIVPEKLSEFRGRIESLKNMGGV